MPKTTPRLPRDYGDPSNTWTDEPTILETSTTTQTYRANVPATTWSEFLTVSIDPIYCESIKFMGNTANWTTPTGHVDGGSAWADETYAYDDVLSITNYASTTSETDYLELTHAALTCSGVRIHAADSKVTYFGTGYSAPDISLDVYYTAAWHNIFSGSITKLTWVEKAIGSSQSVTAARVKFTSAGYTHRLYEFDFGSDVSQIDVDAYYGDAWYDVYQGTYNNDEWVEKSLGGTYKVSEARIRIYNASAGALTTYLKGFRFMKVLGRTEKEERVKRRMFLVPKRKILASNAGAVIGLVEPTYR